MNNKKIAIFISSLASGGAERQTSILLKNLSSICSVTLVLMNDTIFYDIPKNIDIVYLENSSPNESGFKKLIKLPFLGWKYKKICKSKNIDLSFSLLNRPNYINIFSKLFGNKATIAIGERSMPSLQYKSGIQGFINRMLIKTLYGKADIVLANSYGNSKDLEQNFKCKDVKTIYNSIDINAIQKKASEKVEFRDDAFSFITIGRLDQGKNHLLMIEAMQDMDAKLYIIGDGELREFLEKRVKQLQLDDKVFFLGRQENPFAYLKQADCFVFSSNNEGLPNVLLEALACVLPIISTDCQSGPREILAPDSDFSFQLQDGIEIAKFGILVPVQNKPLLVKVMHKIMTDKQLRNEYKQAALQRAKDFDVNKITKQYKEILCVE